MKKKSFIFSAGTLISPEFSLSEDIFIILNYKMEGICDMFNDQVEAREYKLKLISFQGEVAGVSQEVKLYEMDGKEENVLIGEALWLGS